ncbi:MAG: TonB-dependent receptor [Candidatus Eisenbacteria bacterium]|nr:TonB-dependent receptor [Candidatus Eisenbacteria bacterium]
MRPILIGAVLVLSSLLHSPVLAATLHGRCVERASGPGLAGVELVVRAASDSTVLGHTLSDSTGAFVLRELPAGRVLLRASLLGHATVTRSELTLADASADLAVGELVLAISAIAMKGVETSTARGTAIIGVDRNIYLTKDMPAASGGNTTELLRSVPELDVDINDRVSIRGVNGATIQINGRVTPMKGDALTQYLKQLPAASIERVEVIANPSAKNDPEGMAGIVNLVTKEPLDFGFSGSLYASAGPRGGGPGVQAAWQRGKLTLGGGLSGYWNNSDYRYAEDRRNLLTVPPSAFSQRQDSDSRSGFGNTDFSADYAFDKRSTLYASTWGGLNSWHNHSVSRVTVSNDLAGATSLFDRLLAMDGSWRSLTSTMGFAHVVEKGRREATIEYRESIAPTLYESDADQHVFVPTDSLGDLSHQRTEERALERSLQIDDTRPVGKKGKLESGYRGMRRATGSTSRLDYLRGGRSDGLGDYDHLEWFHSAYVTLGSVYKKLSYQAGLRGELADTRFEVHTHPATYDNDYRSLYPSANLAYDLGKGRSLRLTYSRRIERPVPYYLNPDAPTIDSLNIRRGNPFLAPKYTNSFTFDASWSGSRGLLKLSPFYRQTFRNWDQFRQIDAQGVSVTTWLNAASVSAYGVGVVASLRQTGKIGGTLSGNVYRERHDASNLTLRSATDASIWSLSLNATYKLSKDLDLQTFTRYNPAQTQAQGRTSGNIYSNLSARYKLSEKAWLSAYVSDPFKWWKYEFTSSDPSYSQRATNTGSLRSFGVSAGLSWGKPPETKQRKLGQEAAQPSTNGGQ